MARVSRDSEAAHVHLSFPSLSTRRRRDRRAFASAARRASFGGIRLRNDRGIKARFSSFKPCFERAGPRTTASPYEESNREELGTGGKTGRSPTRKRDEPRRGRDVGEENKQVESFEGEDGGQEAQRKQTVTLGREDGDGSVVETDRPTFRYSDFLTDIPVVSSSLVPSQFDVVVFFSVHSIVRITTTSFL